MRINVSSPVLLSPSQMVMWEESLTAFSWNAPSFTSYLYERLNPLKGRMVATFLDPATLPPWFIAGVNGRSLFFNPETFFALTLQEKIFLKAHEVCHPMLGHIIQGTYYRQKGFIDVGFKHLPYNDQLANIAQDLVINDMLIESKIGKMPKGGLWDPSIGTYRDSWIDVYERLLEEQEAEGGGKPCDDGKGGKGKGKPGNSGGSSKMKGKSPGQGKSEEEGDGERERNGQKGFDEHMDFDKGTPKPEGQGESEGEGEQGDDNPHSDEGAEGPVTEEMLAKELQQNQQAVAAAMEAGRARGKLPAALQMFCEKLLAPVVDWPEHIKALFARKVGTGGYDFRKPNRRFLVRDIIVPGRSGKGANLIIGGGDSSGSIYGVAKLVDRFMAEFGGIMEDVQPREAHVIWCDAEVQRVDVLTDMQDVHKMVHKGAVGGGGTDFRPVFAYADSLNQDIDCLVFLTDGDGVFPDKAPRYPVIWASIDPNVSKYPWGDVVYIPVPNEALKK